MEVKIDWKSLVNDQFSVKETFEKRYWEWRERTIRESLAKIVTENPNLLHCVMYEHYEDFAHKIIFGGTDEDGIVRLPKGIGECYIIDLNKYKVLIASETNPRSEEQKAP